MSNLEEEEEEEAGMDRGEQGGVNLGDGCSGEEMEMSEV